MQTRNSFSAFVAAIALTLCGCGTEEWDGSEEIAQSYQALTIPQSKDGPVNPKLPERLTKETGAIHYEWWVSDGLARGDQPTATDAMNLKNEFGFKSLVNLRLESNASKTRAARAGLNYLRIPIVDVGVPTRRQMVKFLNFVTKPENQPAFVHCRAGMNRTGLAVAVYRMAVQGWGVDEALDEARSYGFGVSREVQFVEEFAKDLAAGEIDGYPWVDE